MTFFAAFDLTIAIFFFLGAVIPGWHCHVVFANDKDILDFHEKHTKQLRASISERSPKPTDEAD